MANKSGTRIREELAYNHDKCNGGTRASRASAKKVVLNPLALVCVHGQAPTTKSKPLPRRKATINPLYDGGREMQSSNRRPRSRKLRLFLSLGALFSLTFTSLNFSEKAVTLFVFPSLETTGVSSSSIETFISFVRSEKSKYSKCIERQLYGPVGCYRTLNNTVISDTENFHDYKKQTSKSLKRIRTILAAQEGMLGDLHASAAAIEFTQGTISEIYPEKSHDLQLMQCASNLTLSPALDKKDIGFGEGQYGEGERVLASAVGNIMVMASRVREDISARHQYNLMYLKRKLGEVESLGRPDLHIDELSFLGPLDSLSNDITNVIAASTLNLEGSLAKLKSYIENASLQYDQLHSELSLLKDYSERFFGEIKQFIEDMKGFKSTFESIMKPFQGLMPALNFPDTSIDVPEAYLIKSPTSLPYIRQNVSSILDDLDLAETISLAINATKMQTIEWTRSIGVAADFAFQEGLSKMFEDYDPPDIKVDFFEKEFMNITNGLSESLSALLEESGDYNGNYTIDNAGKVMAAVTDEVLTSSSFGNTFFSFDANFADIENGMHFLFQSLVTLDIVYRIFTAVCTICKYWRNMHTDNPKLVLKVGLSYIARILDS